MNQRSVLMCGLENDPHLQQVAESLRSDGHKPVLWNNRDPNLFDHIQWSVDKNKISQKWDAIWIRQMPPLFPSANIKSNGDCNLIAIRKQRSLRSFFLQWLAHQKENGAQLLPLLQEGSYDQNKGQQLHLAERAKLQIPPTCCTNNLAKALTFVRESKVPCVVKPIIGGALTQSANETNITNMLRDFGPVMVQERVFGKPCRVLWLNEKCLGAFELPISPSVDWRELFERPNAIPPWSAVLLPDPIKIRLSHFARGQMCQLLGFDFVRTEDRFVFLEANTSPAWCDLPKEASQKISQAVALYLA